MINNTTNIQRMGLKEKTSAWEGTKGHSLSLSNRNH